MTIDEFLEAIRKRGDSRLEKGLTSGEEAMWKAGSLSCGVDRTVRSWDIETGKQMWCSKGHKREVTSVSCLGSMALSGSIDKTISLWNVDDGFHVGKVNAHRGWVRGVTLISKDLAASCGEDGVVRVWSLPAMESTSFAVTEDL